MTTTIRQTETKLEIRIAAPSATVWKTLTRDFGTWWPASFNASRPDATMRLELFPGGRMFEEHESGAGTLWANVYAITPGEKLQVSGDLFPGWGGPARWLATWTLSGDGDRTVVRFEEVRLGSTPDAVVESLDKGWLFLLECLRATTEGQPAPVWTD
jgi:uncharacterized protein YndB with AHSA1/START domain